MDDLTFDLVMSFLGSWLRPMLGFMKLEGLLKVLLLKFGNSRLGA